MAANEKVEEEYNLTRTEEEIAKVADEKGLAYFLPNPNEVFIDFDSPYKSYVPNLFFDYLNIFKDIGAAYDSHLITKSPGGRTHIYVRLETELDVKDRIILQLVLGSDKKRELLSLMRELAGSTVPTVLFETVAEAVKVEEWRKKK